MKFEAFPTNDWSNYFDKLGGVRRTPVDFQEFKHTLYILKISNSIWFYQSLPEDVDQEFECVRNPNWPDEEDMPPQGIKEIINLSIEPLAFLCQRFEEPEWVSEYGNRMIITLKQLYSFYYSTL